MGMNYHVGEVASNIYSCYLLHRRRNSKTVSELVYWRALPPSLQHLYPFIPSSPHNTDSPYMNSNFLGPFACRRPIRIACYPLSFSPKCKHVHWSLSANGTVTFSCSIVNSSALITKRHAQEFTTYVKL